MGGEPESGSGIPASVGKYRILRELGRGSMGIVYEAEQTDLGRRVALKVLAPVVANDAEAVERFRREAQAAARLEHPNIAAVHEFGRDAEFTYYSMELVEGRSLQDRLDSTASESFRRIARLFADVAVGLQAAHDTEIIHRDIKPSNILVTADGTPKLVDFGLARVGGTAGTLTSPGQVLGTLRYMSPEQAMSEEIDARTDVYSLGASLYEALTLQPPFQGEDPVEVIHKIISEEPPRPCRLRPEVPKDLETITLKAMAKERRLRYNSASEFAADLERYLRDERIEARRPGPVARARAWINRKPLRGAVVILATLLVAVVLYLARQAWRTERLDFGIAEDTPLREYAPGLDLDAAGIPADAEIRSWARFLLAEDQMGTVVATESPTRKKSRVDLLAFDMQRELLWSARSRWPDYDSTVGTTNAAVGRMHCLVTRRGPGGSEESLVLLGSTEGRAWIGIVDPRTGARRGGWTMPYGFGFPKGVTVLLGLIPDRSDRPRRLLIAGQVRRSETLAWPGLAVYEQDGTEVRRYAFPVLGTKPRAEIGLYYLNCDWSEDQPEVTVRTDEGLFVSLLVKDRLLDISSAVVYLDDRVEMEFDSLNGEGAFEAHYEQEGGYEAYIKKLAKSVFEEGP